MASVQTVNFEASGLHPHIADAGRDKTDISFRDTLTKHKEGEYGASISITPTDLANAMGKRDADQCNLNGVTFNGLTTSSGAPVTGRLTSGQSDSKVEWPGVAARAYGLSSNGTTPGHFTTSGAPNSSVHIPIFKTGDSAKSDADITKRWMNYTGHGVKDMSTGVEEVKDTENPSKTIAYLLPHHEDGILPNGSNPISVALHRNVGKKWMGDRYSKAKMEFGHKDSCIVENHNSPTKKSIVVQPDDYGELKSQFENFLPYGTKQLNVHFTSPDPGSITGSLTLHSGTQEQHPAKRVVDVAATHGIDTSQWDSHCSQIVDTPGVHTADEAEQRQRQLINAVKSKVTGK
jgi:hypothetical protein